MVIDLTASSDEEDAGGAGQDDLNDEDEDEMIHERGVIRNEGEGEERASGLESVSRSHLQ